MDLPVAAYLILGMLGLGAQSGYDIKRLVEVSTRHFSTISRAQIYPLLKQLERDRLVTGHAEAQGNRHRRVYALTAEGHATLQHWLRADDPLTLEIRDLGMLKLFFADAVNPADALQIIRAVRARSQRMLSELRQPSEPAARALDEAGRHFPLHTLGFGIAMHEAVIDHCSALEAKLAP